MKASSESGFEATVIASSPFLSSLAAIVKGAKAKTNLPADKPPALSFLSPEVSTRIAFVSKLSKNVDETTNPRDRQEQWRQQGSNGASGLGAADNAVIKEDGDTARIDWSKVQIPSPIESDEAFAEGARLALSCHAALHHQLADSRNTDGDFAPPLPPDRRRRQQQQQQEPDEFLSLCSGDVVDGPAPFALTMQRICNEIVQGSDDEAFIALCLCLTILETKLYKICREGTAVATGRDETGKCRTSAVPASIPLSPGPTPIDATTSGGDDSAVQSRNGDAIVQAGPAMILRDLIAAPAVKAALPEQMVDVLKLLLLPQGFNIRNLAWHGFLAPAELPRELASLVLMVTLSLPGVSTAALRQHFLQRRGCDNTERSCYASQQRSLDQNQRRGREQSLSQSIAADGENSETPPPCRPAQQSRLPSLTAPKDSAEGQQGRRSDWELDSFDARLKCPSAITSAVRSLVWSGSDGGGRRLNRELNDLARRSAFVMPGREGLAMLALKALRDGRHVLCLVALLPVLEHGLRCLFTFANDSPWHMFAQLRQYYSTLDGFGQRARHQLLLDQELAGFADRPNRLLAVLGPGLSACLLDIFMMDAGPGLRGKIAHGEVDIWSAYFYPPSTIGDDDANGRRHDLLDVTVAIYFVLCGRYDPVMSRTLIHSCPPPFNGFESVEIDDGAGWSGSLSRTGPTTKTRLLADLEEALVMCDAHLNKWVPRFHPHELLEDDMQACWHEFDRLALALKRRGVSVGRLPPEQLERSSNLARMLVTIQPCDEHLRQSKWSTVGRDVPSKSEETTTLSPSVVFHDELSTAEDSIWDTRDDESYEESAPLVLSIVDTAHRLVAPVAQGPEGNGGDLCARNEAGGNYKMTHRRTAAADGGVLSAAIRVRSALLRHTICLSDRFRRILGPSLSESKEGRTKYRSGVAPDRAGCSSYLSPGTRPDCDERPCCESQQSVASAVASSAFAVYVHSKRCSGSDTCCLECLNPAWQSDSRTDETSNIEHAVGGTTESAKAATHCRVANSMGLSREISDGRPFPQENVSLPVEKMVKRSVGGERQGDEKPVGKFLSLPCSGMMEDDKQTPATQNFFRCDKPREGKRISPPTNVVTLVPLPQMGCMRKLCRACAELSRGVRVRIFELERLVASGLARSGHRRSYAETLMIAPTLLCFLALTMSAVEAFVLEWDVRQRVSGGGAATSFVESPAAAVDDAPIDASVTACGGCGVCTAAEIPPKREDYYLEAAPQNAPLRRIRAGEASRDGSKMSSGGSPARHHRNPRQQRKAHVASDAMTVADQLAFLRRLAAVNGALALCVQTANRAEQKTDDVSSRAEHVRGNGGTGRKGYLHGLTELAGFLETKAARRGFAGPQS